jgi:hypothetical protein
VSEQQTSQQRPNHPSTGAHAPNQGLATRSPCRHENSLLARCHLASTHSQPRMPRAPFPKLEYVARHPLCAPYSLANAVSTPTNGGGGPACKAGLAFMPCKNASNAQVMRNYARERVAPVLYIRFDFGAGGEEEKKDGEEAGRWICDGIRIENCVSKAVTRKAAAPLSPLLR